MKLNRRRVMLGGGAAVVVVAAAGAAAWSYRDELFEGSGAEADEAKYAKLLADVREDYVNGRVVEHEGWVLSQHEFDTLGARQTVSAPKV